MTIHSRVKRQGIITSMKISKEATGLKIMAAVEILEEAIGILCKNHSFLVFSIIVILPSCITRLLMDFSTYPQTIEVASQILFVDSRSKYNPKPLDVYIKLHQNIQKLLRNEVMFLVVIDILSFMGLVSSVFAAAGIYKREKMSLRLLFGRLFSKVSIKGALVTHICLNLMSFSFIVIANCWGNAVSHIIRVKIVLRLVAYILPVIIWMYLHAVWSVAMVVSIVELRHGIGSLKRSWMLLRGKRFVGLLLMLVSFGLFNYTSEMSLEAAKIESRMAYRIAFVASYSWLFWFGNVMRWMVSLIFYYHCKRHQGENSEGLVGENVHTVLSPTAPV